MTNSPTAETVHQFEHETWSRCADDYLDGFAGLTVDSLPLLIDAAGISGGHKVLEVGSGPGHIADALTQAGNDVTGIDFSGAMIAVAQRRYPSTHFVEADAEKLPFAGESFSAVVSSFVVHHLARPAVVFGEIFRVLKPGGRVAFTVFADPEAQSSIGAFMGAVAEHHTLDDLPHGPLFGVTDLSVYRSIIEPSGLVDCGFETHDITWRTSSLEPVLKSFWNWGNLGLLSDALQEKIKDTTIANLCEFRSGNGYVFPHKALLGWAGKFGKPEG